MLKDDGVIARNFKQVTALEIERQIIVSMNKEKRRLLNRAKKMYLDKEITEATGKKALFKIVDSFLIKKPGAKLPRQESISDLATNFDDHFLRKITNIRSSLESSRSDHLPPDVVLPIQPFSTFTIVSKSEVIDLIKDCPNKSSLRDPIPTSLLKRYVEYLAFSITVLVNMSLSTGIFPSEMKLAHATPLLKKPYFCSDDLNTARSLCLLFCPN